MGYWIKHFQDGLKIKGIDGDKKASWTKSQLDLMIGVELFYSNMFLIINDVHVAEFWQSDTFECCFPFGSAKRVIRRIQKKIVPSDTCFSYIVTPNIYKAAFNTRAYDTVINIDPQNYGKWFTLEYNLKTLKVDYYFGDKQ